MSDGRPEIIAIEHDDYHAKHIGWIGDLGDRQFILTTPFEPAIGGKPGAEFIALYIFNTDGKLLEAKIDELGPSATLDKERARKLFEERLKELGDVHFGRVYVVFGPTLWYGVRSGRSRAGRRGWRVGGGNAAR
jgi:hypothetical protein